MIFLGIVMIVMAASLVVGLCTGVYLMQQEQKEREDRIRRLRREEMQR